MDENLNAVGPNPTQSVSLSMESNSSKDNTSNNNLKNKFLLTILILAIIIPLFMMFFRENMASVIEELAVPSKAALVKKFKRLNNDELTTTGFPYNNLQNNNAYNKVLNINKPSILWKYENPSFTLPTIYDNKAYISDYYKNDQTYILSLDDGKVLWASKDKDSSNYPLTIGLGSIYGTKCNNGQYSICSLDSGDGSILWRFKTRQVQESGAETVSYFNARQTSDIKLDKNVIYFTAEDNYLYALDAITGEKLWDFSDKPYEVGSLSPMKGFAIDGNLLFLYNGSGIFYALDASNGTIVWKTSLNIPHDKYYGYAFSPVVASNRVFLPIFDGTMYVLNEETGKLVWKFKLPITRKSSAAYSYISEPSVYSSSVYLSDNVGYLHELAVEDGKEIRKVFLGDYRLSTPIITPEQIYIMSTNENLSVALSLYAKQEGILSEKPKSILFDIDRKTFDQKWAFELDSSCDSACSGLDVQRFPTVFQDKLLVPGGSFLYLVGESN